MTGYRQDRFDLNAEDPKVEKPKGRWKWAVAGIAYMVPLIWLWIHVDFPDSMGVHITDHRAAGALESWYYSYLLLERHHILDIVTFTYMWAPVAALIAWLALPKLRTANFSLYSDSSKGA